MFGKEISLRSILQINFFRCLVFLAILTALFSYLSPYFLSFSNLDNILSASAVTGLLALGATFVIASGGIDLSIASVMALAGTVCAFVLRDSPINSLDSFALCIVVGTLCGLVTGLLVNITRAPSFIVTLGMLSVARAVAYITAQGTPIYDLPPYITALGQGKICGVSNPVIILLASSLVAHIMLHKTSFGIHALVYGDSPTAAEEMGLRVNILRLKIYALSGLFSGIAGFVFMARTNAGDPTAGQNYELVAITAVILGGTKLFGGQATIFGTLLGVICLGVLQNGLNLLAVSTYYQVLFVGLVLIGAALLERVGRE
jgi:ribose transport system permease protein